MGLSLDIKRFSNEIDGVFSTIKTMLIDLADEEYSFFNLEADIQRVINKAGCHVLTSVINQYDTQSDTIEYRQCRYNKAGLYSKTYQTVFGKIDVERTIYRNSASKTEKSICPLEIRAGILD